MIKLYEVADDSYTRVYYLDSGNELLNKQRAYRAYIREQNTKKYDLLCSCKNDGTWDFWDKHETRTEFFSNWEDSQKHNTMLGFADSTY